jgi:hypothetical protein
LSDQVLTSGINEIVEMDADRRAGFLASQASFVASGRHSSKSPEVLLERGRPIE